LEVAYPEELREDGETTHLFLLAAQYLEAGGRSLGQDLGTMPPPAVESFNELAQQVNLCLWQIDNTFASAQTTTSILLVGDWLNMVYW